MSENADWPYQFESLVTAYVFQCVPKEELQAVIVVLETACLHTSSVYTSGSHSSIAASLTEVGERTVAHGRSMPHFPFALQLGLCRREGILKVLTSTNTNRSPMSSGTLVTNLWHTLFNLSCRFEFASSAFYHLTYVPPTNKNMSMIAIQ